MKDDGIALLLAMVILMVISALSSALVLWTMTEAQIARGFGLGVEGRYAAVAAAERGLIELAAPANWDALLNGSRRSLFSDGAPTGTRRLSDGTTLDLDGVRNLANCGHVGACSEAELVAVSPERPWGVNNPRWQLLAYGALGDAISAPSPSPFYLVVLVADDPSERDGDPSRDAADPADPGAGIIQLRGEAFGPRGTHRAVAVTVARSAASGAAAAGLRLLAWRSVG